MNVRSHNSTPAPSTCLMMNVLISLRVFPTTRILFNLHGRMFSIKLYCWLYTAVCLRNVVGHLLNQYATERHKRIPSLNLNFALFQCTNTAHRLPLCRPIQDTVPFLLSSVFVTHCILPNCFVKRRMFIEDRDQIINSATILRNKIKLRFC